MKRVLRKYKQLANAIDKEIKVKKTSCEWYCLPVEKKIFIPQLASETSDIAFLKSIEKRLPTNKKELLEEFPVWVWAFLHEIGHIQHKHTKQIIMGEIVANFLGRLGCYKLANLIYFNIKQEKQATQWAVDYIIQNEDFVYNQAMEIYKAYKKYYKKLKISIDNE